MARDYSRGSLRSTVWLAFDETPSSDTLVDGSVAFAAVAIHLS